MATATGKKESASNGRLATVEQWAKAAEHTITVPSGVRIKIRIPDLSILAASGAIPEHLRGIAAKAIADDLNTEIIDRDEQTGAVSLNAEKMGQAVELYRWLILQMVIEPQLSDEAVQLLPAEDTELLVSIARRERDVDALGVRLGVDPLSRWDRFRREHKCLEDCEACEASRDAFSTHGLDDV